MNDSTPPLKPDEPSDLSKCTPKQDQDGRSGTTCDLPETCYCPECGYDLRGQTAERCPECGFHYDLPGLESVRNLRLEACLAPLLDAITVCFAGLGLFGIRLLCLINAPWNPMGSSRLPLFTGVMAALVAGMISIIASATRQWALGGTSGDPTSANAFIRWVLNRDLRAALLYVVLATNCAVLTMVHPQSSAFLILVTIFISGAWTVLGESRLQRQIKLSQTANLPSTEAVALQRTRWTAWTLLGVLLLCGVIAASL